MSRSFRKSPCKSYTNAGSCKAWKRSVNKTLRSKIKVLLKTCQNFDNVIYPFLDEVGNPYNSPKDGKPGWFNKPHEEDGYSPYSKEYDKWYSLENWIKVFRK